MQMIVYKCVIVIILYCHEAKILAALFRSVWIDVMQLKIKQRLSYENILNVIFI